MAGSRRRKNNGKWGLKPMFRLRQLPSSINADLPANWLREEKTTTSERVSHRQSAKNYTWRLIFQRLNRQLAASEKQWLVLVLSSAQWSFFSNFMMTIQFKRMIYVVTAASATAAAAAVVVPYVSTCSPLGCSGI